MDEARKNIFLKDVYYSYIENRGDFSVTPLVVGFERCRKSKMRITSNKTCYILHYVLSGEGTIHIKNRTYNITEGQFFLLPPHSNAVYEPSRQNPWSYIWIEMSGPYIREALDSTIFSWENFIFDDTERREMGALMTKMLEEDCLSTEASEGVLIAAYILKFFAFMIHHYPKNESVNISKKEETVKAIERYLSLHYNDPLLSMENVSTHFSFSSSYLTRLFKETTGITPTQYVDEIRMKKAIELLNHRSLTIFQIAEAVGYKNQFYFTKRFKKYYGMPPTQYKQKNTADLD